MAIELGYIWKLKLNVEKSNIVHFRSKRQQRTDFNFNFGEKEITVVDKYKYLGVFFDEYLTFETCAKILSESAGRALGGVIHKYRNLKDVGYYTFEKMYNAGVTAISDYGAEIWGFKNFSFNNNVQNRAMRYYLGVHRFAPIAGMLGDFGWLSCKYRRYICMLRFWNRMICTSDERIVKKLFNYDYAMCNKNWCADVKNILSTLEMGDVFEQKRVCHVKEVKTKLMCLNEEEWKEDISNKPKLRTYRLFKETFSTENYICCYMSKRNRSLLAQFRLGILQLEVETGRYKNTSLEERICKLCDKNEVEDEFHFVISCPIYSNYRVKLFANALNVITNFNEQSEQEKFVNLAKMCQKYLSIYLCECIQHRKNIMYV